jgi:hypothetical protein
MYNVRLFGMITTNSPSIMNIKMEKEEMQFIPALKINYPGINSANEINHLD